MLIYDAANLPEAAEFIDAMATAWRARTVFQVSTLSRTCPGILPAYDPWPLGFDAVTCLRSESCHDLLEARDRARKAEAGFHQWSAATGLGRQRRAMRNAFLAKAQSRLRRCSGRPVASFRIRRRCPFSCWMNWRNSRGRKRLIHAFWTNWDNSPTVGSPRTNLARTPPLNHFELTFAKRSDELRLFHQPTALCFVKSWNEWAEGTIWSPTVSSAINASKCCVKSRDR